MAKEKIVKEIVDGIISVALIITMVFTCPDRAKHVKAMSERYANSIQTELGGGLIGGLVYKASEKASEFIIDNSLEYRNLWLFSLGLLREGSDIQMFSIGAFGHVAAIKSSKKKE